MGRSYLMQWDEKNRRWYKRTPKEFLDVAKKKITKVSCKQLRSAPTCVASYKAANQWWKEQVEQWRRMRSGQNEARFPQGQEDAETLAQMAAWLKERGRTEEADSKAEIAREIRQSIEQGREPAYTDRDIFSISNWDNLTDEDFQARYVSDVDVWTDRLANSEPPPREKTVQAWLDTFVEVLKQKTKPQSLQNIQRQLNVFPCWHGASTSIETIDEAVVRSFYLHLLGNGLADSTNRDTFSTWRRWINFLADENQIERPRNLMSREFSFRVSHSPQAPELEDITAFLDVIPNDRIRLYALLCLNCGMNNSDVGQLHNTNHSWKRAQALLQDRKLTNGHVDWAEGRIVRQRQKTEGKGRVPTVCYKLWDKTFDLLKQFRSDDVRYCLLTEQGTVLWKRGEKRKDAIYDRAWKDLKNLTPKELRSGSATVLGQHDSYKLYISHYLADSPRGIPDRHYVVPSQSQFDLAIAWLGESLGIQ